MRAQKKVLSAVQLPSKPGARPATSPGSRPGNPLPAQRAPQAAGGLRANRRVQGLGAPSPSRPTRGGGGDNLLGLSRVIVDVGTGAGIRPLPTKVREGKEGEPARNFVPQTRQQQWRELSTAPTGDVSLVRGPRAGSADWPPAGSWRDSGSADWPPSAQGAGLGGTLIGRRPSRGRDSGHAD